MQGGIFMGRKPGNFPVTGLDHPTYWLVG